MPNKYINKLAKQRILVIGGTSGIGFCVVENALEHGATVIVASSQQSSVDKTIKRLTESYADAAEKVSGHTIDLQSDHVESSIEELLKFATNDGKDLLDHIVSTAGAPNVMGHTSQYGGLEQLTIGLRGRVNAPLLIAKLAPGKFLKVADTSSLTFTGGVRSHVPGKGWTLSAGSGAMLSGVIRGLAVDLAPIRANLVEPGAIDTELFSKFMPNEEVRKKAQGTFAENTLAGRLGSPEDMSELYIYIMKDSYITGQSILSEGGLILGPLSRV